MSDRTAIARQAAAGLRRFAPSAAATPVLIGFDGFVDSIIEVVDKRRDTDHYQPVATISRFGEKITAAAGQSSNYELVTKLEKLGGNGPIMANAMAAAGLDLTYVGPLGHPTIHPAFEELARVAEVHSVAEPGFTDALEFTDGKLLLGKYDHVRTLDWETIAQTVNRRRFAELVSRSRLIGMVNWTMLAKIETVWDQLENVLKQVGSKGGGAAGAERTFIFIDLADPEKRTDEDLARALEWVGRLDAHADVLLGLNLKEATQAAANLGLAVADDREAAIEQTARDIREAIGNYGVIVHPRRGAAASLKTAAGVESATFNGPFTAAPRLSTGAGDNFNAGFCLGQIAGLPLDQCLCVGTATSGYYVRHAKSPTLDDLAAFCDDLPAPE